MLTFAEKLSIIESFPELTRHDVSLGRVNFHYNDSVLDKKIVVYRLHPNGNGFVYAGEIANLDDAYTVDEKGMVNIRDFTEEELQSIVAASIYSLSQSANEPLEEQWRNPDDILLLLAQELDSWNVYTGDILEATFSTYDAARDYLEEEGFTRIASNK